MTKQATPDRVRAAEQFIDRVLQLGPAHGRPATVPEETYRRAVLQAASLFPNLRLDG